MVEWFKIDSRVPTRALQAYLVLIGCAWNNQLITYGKLSQNQMEYGDGGILDRPLGCIMGWCFEQGLPPLTVLVVNKDHGLPGAGLGTVKGGNFPAAMQQVFKFNWFSILPPELEMLEAAGNRATGNTLIPPQKLHY
jgi:hypothetical protein